MVGSLGIFISSKQSISPYKVLLIFLKFSKAGPCLTLAILSKTEPWQIQTQPLYGPRYGIGIQPKWVHIAETHKILEFKSLFKFTGLVGSNKLQAG